MRRSAIHAVHADAPESRATNAGPAGLHAIHAVHADGLTRYKEDHFTSSVYVDPSALPASSAYGPHWRGDDGHPPGRTSPRPPHRPPTGLRAPASEAISSAQAHRPAFLSHQPRHSRSPYPQPYPRLVLGPPVRDREPSSPSLSDGWGGGGNKNPITDRTSSPPSTRRADVALERFLLGIQHP